MATTIDIVTAEPIATINPNIYGHFSEHLGTCIYDGIWVGQDSTTAHTDGLANDVVTALRKIKPPVMRWPGGCFADDYHWRDGIGPSEHRPRRINIHWGEVVESNRFGTHEFMNFCRHIGAQPYLAGNLGSGTPHELRDWVEYCNYPNGTTLTDERAANGAADPFGVRYWGVGNEAWGCGGLFTPDDYATEYRRFASYIRNFGGDRPFLIACGPDRNDLEWTRRFFTHLQARFHARGRPIPISGFAAHYYCHTTTTATEYDDDGWYGVLAQAQGMEPLVVQQRALMDAFDPDRSIGLIVDEWGTWHRPVPGRNPRFLWQQNTLRDALVAALTLDIFNRHADKVVMANIAQTVNVLQALLLTENGKTVTTPTYHVYDLYQGHQGGQSVRTIFEAPEVVFGPAGVEKRLFGLAGSASITNRTLTLTVVNPRIGLPVEAAIRLHGEASIKAACEVVLTHADIHAHNTFDAPDAVQLSEPVVLPVVGRSFSHVFAPQSVTRLELTLE
ncbi:MAG: alpha-L-arabinofuranosidase C-terminal domain-containing protein [Herpetosiphon sp.]